jgi:hypothetical protein
MQQAALFRRERQLVPGKSYRKVTLNELNHLLPFEKSATGGINLKHYF